MRKPVLVLLLTFLPWLSSAEAQDIEWGKRVRLATTAGDRLTGRVVETTPDAIVIELDDSSGSRSIPKTELAGLEAEAPRSRCRGAWSKAKWGALIGAVSGTTLGFQHEQVGEDGSTVAEAVALGAWSGGLFGGLIGAAIGALNPGNDWVKVDPRVQVDARDPGFSLSFTIEF